ncbi:MAG: hypothetical protein KatS3mg113_0613 [Planctomycetaceae bacterium]|nr:MAG: hypothetical protein KatS3mg113_0613 [Planctomycetaceae bacterium]
MSPEVAQPSSRERASVTAPSAQKPVEIVDAVVVRFCGDSGDGMQLAGTQFTNVSAVFGNDVSTLPDFPAENPRPSRFVSWGEWLSGVFFQPRYLHAGR